MKIAIIGYGKLGRMIESTARERGHQIGSIIDLGDEHLMQKGNLGQHDAALEFTTPETAFDNISRCMDAGVPVVSGTTGWTARLDELKQRCSKEGCSFFYASNFSLGVNILFYLNRQLARIMDRYEQYDVNLKEVHHIHKADAPSGTALHLAEDILGEIRRKKAWSMETDAPKEKLKIEALREGEVTGIHEVHYESPYDVLSLHHNARNRRGFALGAVMAAEYLQDRKGFHTMDEMLNL